MINTVKNYLQENNIKNQNVIIGFSSGPDSCALALILNELKELFNLKITLAYFNHGWRIEAKDEEEFTKSFAQKINVDFYIGKAPKNTPKTEENARNLRYKFFEKTAKKFNSNVVLLAHNKNDNIETLIYRVIKGTSIKGLCSIPHHRDIFYRPILEIEKKDIIEFLKTKNQIFMIDSSNNNLKYKRNLIRNEILPLFEKINPQFIDSINNLIKNSISSQKIIDSSINEIKNKIIKNESIIYNEFKILNTEYRYEIINDFFGKYLKYRDFKAIEKIDNFIQKNTNSKMSLNSNLFLKIKDNKISVEKKAIKNNNILLINKIGEYCFEGKKLKIEKVIKDDNIFPLATDKTCYLDFEFPICIRYRKNGDKFSPFGNKSKNLKLKDYLINQKVEQNLKDKIMLICKENNVLWTIGYNISNKFKVKNKQCYKLTLE